MNINNNKHVPMRMCVACRKMHPKSSLMRFIKDENNNISVDTTGNSLTRGFYLCKCEECLTLAKKKKCFERARKSYVDDEFYNSILKLIKEETVI